MIIDRAPLYEGNVRVGAFLTLHQPTRVEKAVNRLRTHRYTHSQTARYKLESAFTGARRNGKAGLFEAANEGTGLLDEVAEMPPILQTRLLRVLQEGEVTRVGGTDTLQVNVRIVAATHRNHWERVREGAFRQDLFYRLSVLRLQVPPLRVRPEDRDILTTALISADAARAPCRLG
ncbi:sigma 54-interacting transcriptional regulator [Cupriavidus sp. L7L]|uniref:sigma 54-interacting transcriptional regulator n=1 Tax=Cupriavidus sp. L7L TaxID=2546443 RepID=UPI0026AE7626